MGRNSAPGRMRAVIALSVWVGAACLVHALLRPELGDKARRLHEAIELQLSPHAPPPAPTRAHDPDEIEPWELVSV